MKRSEVKCKTEVIGLSVIRVWIYILQAGEIETITANARLLRSIAELIRQPGEGDIRTMVEHWARGARTAATYRIEVKHKKGASQEECRETLLDKMRSIERMFKGWQADAPDCESHEILPKLTTKDLLTEAFIHLCAVRDGREQISQPLIEKIARNL